jgi:hypothetical protein
MTAHAYNIVGATLIGGAILMLVVAGHFARRYPSGFGVGNFATLVPALAIAAVLAGVICLLSAILSGIGRP